MDDKKMYSVYVNNKLKTNDKEKRIMAKIQFLSLLKDGLDTDLNINKPVFDIKFELIEEVENEN